MKQVDFGCSPESNNKLLVKYKQNVSRKVSQPISDESIELEG